MSPEHCIESACCKTADALLYSNLKKLYQTDPFCVVNGFVEVVSLTPRHQLVTVGDASSVSH